MSFEIVDGVLKKYTGNDTDVEIPDNVTSIGWRAFSECAELKSVTIPASVTSIGDSAFSYCKNLTSVIIGNSVKKIGDNAFSCCENLTNVVIGNSVTKIGAGAFGCCDGLKSIVIPNSVVAFDYNDYDGGTFANCPNLQEIVFCGNVTAIPKNTFESCPNFKVVIDKDLIHSDSGLSAKYVDFDFDYDNTDLAYISLFSSGKKWQEWLQDRITDADSIFGEMLIILDSNPEYVKKAKKGLTWYMQTYSAAISAENSNRATAMLNAVAGKKASAKKQKEDALAAFEKPFLEMISDAEIDDGVQNAIKKGLLYEENMMLCSPKILQFIVDTACKQFRKEAAKYDAEYGAPNTSEDSTLMKRMEIADKLASALRKDSFRDYLFYEVDSPKYRVFLPAWARYATDKEISKVVGSYKKWMRGKTKERYRAEEVNELLLLSDTTAAAKFFDSIGELKKYAQKRNMTESELRSSVMLPDFGFDTDGVKRFDIGGNVIEARITDALKIELFDTNAQKVIRSFPKKSDDPAKAEACAKEFAEFKKQVTTFIKDFDAQIAKMYMDGENIGFNTWNKVYREHPVISKLCNLIIWQDSNNHTFAVIGHQIVDSSNAAYSPNGSIKVAHVLDMEPEDIVRWQRLLVDKKQSLLLEQVWEPVRQSKNTVDSSRYSGAVISSKERNLLKTRLKRRGINVSAGEVQREYDHRAGKYVFDPENDMFFDDVSTLHYAVDEKSGDLTLGDFSVKRSNNIRKLNAILLELDRITLSAQIRNDNVEAIEEKQLDDLTVSQISDFIKLATESNAANCTALLLDYKNKKYPEYDNFDEFVLEW